MAQEGGTPTESMTKSAVPLGRASDPKLTAPSFAYRQKDKQSILKEKYCSFPR